MYIHTCKLVFLKFSLLSDSSLQKNEQRFLPLLSSLFFFPSYIPYYSITQFSLFLLFFFSLKIEENRIFKLLVNIVEIHETIISWKEINKKQHQQYIYIYIYLQVNTISYKIDLDVRIILSGFLCFWILFCGSGSYNFPLPNLQKRTLTTNGCTKT